MHERGTKSYASTSKGFRQSPRKTRVVIGDSDGENEFRRQSEGVEREILIMLMLDFELPKKAKWLARVILYEAFSPKSTTTLTRLFEDPFLLIYLGILILS